jgi:hypothetical protein
MKLYIGMPVKWFRHPESFGEVLQIEDDNFYVQWKDHSWAKQAVSIYSIVYNWDTGDIVLNKELLWKQEINEIVNAKV